MTDPITSLGLSSSAARALLQRVGPNELPEPNRRTLVHIILGVLREPMFLLLALAALIYLAIGDPHESLLLAAFAMLSIGLVVLQESRSERALQALRALSAPSVRVIRDGTLQRIPSRELVPGDCLLASEGERVGADGWIVRAENLQIDESLLTGESMPVAKHASAADAARESPAPGGEQPGYAYAGTLVVAGHAHVLVDRTGIATAAGRIGVSLAQIESESTLLQRQVGRLVRLFGGIAAAVSLAVVLGYGLLRGDWIAGLLSGIALAMAMLPEEFPMALAVFLALGAWRMTRVQVLARRPAMVETLGAASVLCVDKTGTLTLNQMEVQVLCSEDGQRWKASAELPEAWHALLEYAVLACKRQAHDPMDTAIHRLGASVRWHAEHLHPDDGLAHEYPLTAERPAFIRLWRRSPGHLVGACKGAPEAVLRLCGVDEDGSARILQQVQALAATGLRVLAVASVESAQEDAPADPAALPWRYRGLLALADPLREGVPAAMRTAQAAGIRVMMITGDYPRTALSIAAEAGIDTRGGALTGADLDALSDAELREQVRRVHVYARVRPEQKLRLVHACKAAGEVVAMTGDGVNDAPALKAAHIGIAMGGRGTDVAREAAGIVLLDDNIARINEAVQLGRRIFENLRKVLIYIAAIHLPIAGLALAPLLFGLPPLLLPMHVVLVEMVVDPICSIAFENEPGAPDLMRRGPRSATEPLVGASQLLLSAVLGSVLLLACLGLYRWQLDQGADIARTLAFVALTAGNLMLVRVIATPGSTLRALAAPGHRAFWLISAAVSAVIALCIAVPGLAALFRFEFPGWSALLLAIAVGAGASLSGDLAKRIPAVRRALNVQPNQRASARNASSESA